MAKTFKKKTISEILMSNTINDLNPVTDGNDSSSNLSIYRKDRGAYCSNCGSNGTVHTLKNKKGGDIKSICTKCGKIFINHDCSKERKIEFKGVRCPNCRNEDVSSIVKYGRDRYGQRYKCNKCGRTFRKESDYKNI